MKKGLLILLLFIVYGTCWSQNAITLITPYDKDTIETVYPVFTWHYIKSFQKRNNIQYSFTLVKLENEQSAQAGITVNTPLLHIESIQGFQFSYPFDAPELKYNNRYGWRLQKKVNGVVVSSSEAWEFILYKEIKIPMKYALLNTAYSSTIYNVEEKGFFFKMRSRYGGGKPLNIKILSSRSKQMEVALGEDKKLGTDEEPEKTGRDFYFLKTDSYPPGVYTLIVMDPKGNEYNTRFRVK